LGTQTKALNEPMHGSSAWTQGVKSMQVVVRYVRDDAGDAGLQLEYIVERAANAFWEL